MKAHQRSVSVGGRNEPGQRQYNHRFSVFHRRTNVLMFNNQNRIEPIMPELMQGDVDSVEDYDRFYQSRAVNQMTKNNKSVRITINEKKKLEKQSKLKEKRQKFLQQSPAKSMHIKKDNFNDIYSDINVANRF